MIYEMINSSITNVPIMPPGAQFNPLKISIAIFLLFGLGYLAKMLRKDMKGRMKKGISVKKSNISGVTGLKNKWESNLAILKEKSNDKENYLYQQPWLMTLGLKSCGKSTLLFNSGKSVVRNGIQTGEVRPTSDCDWWMFSEEFLVLDTSGRYLETSQEKSEWRTLVSLLRNTKKRDPLQGIIVVKDVIELIESSEEKLKQDGIDLKECIESIKCNAKENIPIYVIINKLDKIPSFHEMIKSISNVQKELFGGQIETENWKSGYYDLMLLLRKNLSAIQNQVLYKYRAEKYELLKLGADFAEMSKNLEIFLTQLINANAYREAGQLRGIYFCSSKFTKSDGSTEPVFVKKLFTRLNVNDSLVSEKYNILNTKNILITCLMLILLVFNIIGITSSKKLSGLFEQANHSDETEEVYSVSRKIDTITNRLPLLQFYPVSKIKKRNHKIFIEKYDKFERQEKSTEKYISYFIYALNDVYKNDLKDTGWYNYEIIRYYQQLLSNEKKNKEIATLLEEIKNRGKDAFNDEINEIFDNPSDPETRYVDWHNMIISLRRNIELTRKQSKLRR